MWNKSEIQWYIYVVQVDNIPLLIYKIQLLLQAVIKKQNSG